MSIDGKRKLHIARVPDYGTEVLTKCGRKKNTMPNGLGNFTNPDARLCPQCVNLAEAEGTTVTMEWVDYASGTTAVAHWRVKATPPRLELITKGINSAIVDRNDPEAPPLVLTHDKLEEVLGRRTLGILWDAHNEELTLTK